MKKTLSLLLSLVMLLALFVPTASAAGTGSISLTQKYTIAAGQEESYGVPPVVIDLDHDGRLEVLHGAYTLTVADAATGAVKWRTNKSNGAMFCKFIVKDFNGDGRNEIALGYTSGTISLLNDQGQTMPGFPITVAPSTRIESLAADDVDGDGKVEIIAGVFNGLNPASCVYVYGCDGTLKPGWPQLQDDPSHNLTASTYSFLVCNDGIATGDLDGDGLPEILVPTDNYFVGAYNGDGTPVMVSSKFNNLDVFNYGGQVPWFGVGFWEDYSEELSRGNGGLGWGPPYKSIEELGRKGTYGSGMSYATVRFADVDGDGTQEVLITATMFDRTASLLNPGNINFYNITHAQYSTVYILNGDRTRFNQNGCNWESIPNNLTNPQLGKPLNQNPIGGDGNTRLLDGGVHSVPVVGDINGDGVNEILFNTFDGKVHCYSAKDSSKELSGWPFTLPLNATGSVYEYAAEPTLADLDGDGTPEVVLVSWTDNYNSNHHTGQNGSIYILNGSGKLLAQEKLAPMGTYDNISRSKPVVADIDGDNQMEILISSSDFGGLIAYDVTVAGKLNSGKTANVTDNKLTINGEEVTPTAYKIGGSNYFKLRDLAALLNGTGASFSVGYDASTESITVTTGEEYELLGTELRVPSAGAQKATVSTDVTYINGIKAEGLTVYKIKGNNYYKLRDLANAMGTFDVDYDEATATAIITTK